MAHDPPTRVSLLGSWPPAASDAADVDSRRAELFHYLLIGSPIGEEDVDIVEIADVAERHPAELRGVGYRNNPLRGFGGGSLHRRLGEQVRCDAGLDVDAAGTHHARVEPELREGWFGETSNQRQLAGTNFTAREKELDARAFVELENGSESEGHDGHPPVAQRPCHLHGRGSPVEDDRLSVGQEAGGGGAYRGLGFVGLESPNAVRGFLGAEEDAGRTTVHASQTPAVFERFEIAPHGHFGASECEGQLPDQHRTALTEGLHDRLVAHLHIHIVYSNIFYVRTHTVASQPPVEAVVFDLGGVLLDWNPRYLYRKLFTDEAAMEWFLAEICSPIWHAPHDRGVSTAASCAELTSHHPEYSDLIWAWSTRSEEMIGGVHAGSIEVLRSVRETGVPCYALTNMEAETYPLRLRRFPFLGWFDGTVVSGREGVAKPEPAIFTRLLERFGLDPATTLMIDDTKENLEAANKVGIQTALFRSSGQLRAELETAGVLPESRPNSSLTTGRRLPAAPRRKTVKQTTGPRSTVEGRP